MEYYINSKGKTVKKVFSCTSFEITTLQTLISDSIKMIQQESLFIYNSN
jgi:hypothetical protein